MVEIILKKGNLDDTCTFKEAPIGVLMYGPGTTDAIYIKLDPQTLIGFFEKAFAVYPERDVPPLWRFKLCSTDTEIVIRQRKAKV